MKWVRRIVMFLLILAIAGSGVMAFLSYGPWKDAKADLDEAQSKTFEPDDFKTSFTPQENQDSVAFVYDLYPDGSAVAGTSYAVGELDEKVQYFVTNGHVVQPHMEEGLPLYIVFGDSFIDGIEAEVIFYQFDAELDMAIIKIPQPTNERKPVIIRDTSEVETGEKVTAIGYPDKAMEADSTLSVGKSAQTVTSGVIAKVDCVPSAYGYSYKSLQHDAFISHGNSGGPLLDQNGFLVGMNTLTNPGSENVHFAITANEIKQRLDANKIKYVKSEDYLDDIEDEISSEKKKFEKKQKSEISDIEDEITEARNKFFIFVIAGGVCAVVLLILFIVGNKKVVMVGEQDDGKKSYLYCEKGLFAGQKYEITGQTMTIGRDTHSCTIVFPEETPGISSNHCSIYFDARTKAFVLTDNGSTYGTYLSDGRKLTKGVPEQLLPGSTFALADKANEFKVDRE